ncbi:MAG: TssQ family T6SS-associated lipoprotein [Betaproteobacteria bacterium]|nr:TssQ family T6SS-associated lipoprotein [Betaproteobacteria bacterium]
MHAPLRPLAAVALAAIVAACAPVTPPPAQQPVAPQITEDTLRARAREQLATGLKQYDSGEYDAALRSLVASLDHGLLPKMDQSVARKHIAFVHCLSGRETQCRDEFRKAFEIDPAFSLSPAEDGHPIWGPVYRAVRTQLIAEREAAQGKPTAPLARAEQMLADGLVKYESGDFAESQRLLEQSLKEGLREKQDQVRAMKHVAFCLCLAGKYPACRAQFLKIFDVDPNFDLTPAEAGHPNWTKTFAGARAQAQAKRTGTQAPAPGSAPAPAPAAKKG